MFPGNCIASKVSTSLVIFLPQKFLSESFKFSFFDENYFFFIFPQRKCNFVKLKKTENKVKVDQSFHFLVRKLRVISWPLVV